MGLQQIYDTNAEVLNKLEAATVRDTFRDDYLVRAFARAAAATPFVGVCMAVEKIAKVTGRPLDTSRLL